MIWLQAREYEREATKGSRSSLDWSGLGAGNSQQSRVSGDGSIQAHSTSQRKQGSGFSAPPLEVFLVALVCISVFVCPPIFLVV